MTEHPTPIVEAGAEPAAPKPVFNTDLPHATPERPISAAARRALEEAADRRARQEAVQADTEYGGPSGPEPTRFGDWEKKGLAVDF